MAAETENYQDNTMDILNQQLTNISAENQFLTFKIEDEEYGVDVLKVQEIIRYRKPTKIPNTPAVVKGVINFRGEVSPVLDMREKFDFETRNYNSFTVIIVLEIQSKIISIIVDQVSDILSFSKDDIQKTLDFSSDIDTEFIDGMAKLDNRLIMLLNLDLLLSFKELNVVSNIDSEIIDKKDEAVESRKEGETSEVTSDTSENE
ncbi:MAG: chemotaxis protein CheW [Halothermotrichaceae bacterium]